MYHISKTSWVIFRALSAPSLFTEKCLLDNTTGIRYLNPNRLLPQYDCCLISAPTTYCDTSFYGTRSQIFYFDLKKRILIIRTLRQAQDLAHGAEAGCPSAGAPSAQAA
ncbi:MAG TPA: hypothetical protein ENI07_09800 [Desulfobacterales bacterium]|nr:hypothetical protein [Desulfobacterales bacterium]